MSLENRVIQFDTICLECSSLFARKNKEYGDTIKETGVLGASVELIGVVARLKELVLRNPSRAKLYRDSIKDILMDIHNYSVIGLMMMEENNWKGV